MLHHLLYSPYYFAVRRPLPQSLSTATRKSPLRISLPEDPGQAVLEVIEVDNKEGKLLLLFTYT